MTATASLLFTFVDRAAAAGDAFLSGESAL
jgi:hypothetical protein